MSGNARRFLNRQNPLGGHPVFLEPRLDGLVSNAQRCSQRLQPSSPLDVFFGKSIHAASLQFIIVKNNQDTACNYNLNL